MSNSVVNIRNYTRTMKRDTAELKQRKFYRNLRRILPIFMEPAQGILIRINKKKLYYRF